MHVKRGRDTKIPQSSGPPVKVGDEAVHKELGDRMERVATTASSLEAEQDSGSGPKCQDTILGGVDAQTRMRSRKLTRRFRNSMEVSQNKEQDVLSTAQAYGKAAKRLQGLLQSTTAQILSLQICGMVAATEPKTIQKVVQIYGALTDDVIRNGSIKKVEKRGNVGEPSKDTNGRDDNKRTRTRNAFTSTANPDCKGVPRNVNPVNDRNPIVRACYECGSTDHVRSGCPRLNRAQGPEGNHPRDRGNQGNQARGIEPNELGFRYEIEIASGQLVEIDKVIKGCKLEIEGHVFDIDLIPFGHGSVDVIIGMDWLSNHKAEIICYEKVVRIPLLDGKVLRVLGEIGKSMLVQGPIQQGEGSTVPVESHHIPITTPSTSQPPLSSPSRVPTPPHDSPLPGGHTPGSDEGSMTLNELTVLCTQLSTKVARLEQDLKQTKKVYGNAYTKLIMGVKKLEHKVKSRQPKRRARVVIFDTEKDLEDPSKQGRRIAEIDQNTSISLPTELVEDLGSGEKGEKEISTANISVSTASATPEVSTAAENLVDAEIAKQLQEEFDRARQEQEVVAKADQAYDIDWSDPAVLRYHALQNRSFSVAEEKKNDDSQQQSGSSKKRSREYSDEDNAKKQKLEDDAEKEELRDSMDVVLRDDIAIDVESLATKYPIVD
ncbi:putative reverse transcriptase domain-containing protein [Tanacetum coccineum]